jgi:hypothetical protein
MTLRLDVRLWTAIALIGICGFSIAQGWGIVRFSLAMANIYHPSEKRAEIVNTWASAPNVGSEALQAELTQQKINISDAKTANRRRELLSSILSIEPLSPVNWLSLSQTQLVTDQPMEQVFGSLELSMLTGPHEGYVTAERGTYGVSLWERLSADLQRRVTIDVADGDIVGNDKFRVFLSKQPERVRTELRSAMLAMGLSAKEVEKRLGF